MTTTTRETEEVGFLTYTPPEDDLSLSRFLEAMDTMFESLGGRLVISDTSMTFPIRYVKKFPQILHDRYMGGGKKVNITYKKDKNMPGGFGMIMWRCDGDDFTKEGEPIWKVLEFWKKPLDEEMTGAYFQLEKEGWVKDHVQNFDKEMVIEIFGPEEKEKDESSESTESPNKKAKLSSDEY